MDGNKNMNEYKQDISFDKPKPVKRTKNQEKRIDTSCPFYNAEGMCANYHIKKFCRSLSCRRKK